MARAATKIYVPLDVMFFDDDKVEKAGEAATYLYLNMLTKAKAIDRDGVLTEQQIAKLAISNWRKRLETLVALGLVEFVGDDYRIAGWLKWNESVDDRAERLKKDRESKANRARLRALEDAKRLEAEQ